MHVNGVRETRTVKLELGQVVHNFVVERVLGTGGTAVVYLVRERGGRVVHALKVLTVSSPAIRERMRREGEVQSALRHPNIVPVQDVLDLDGSPALLMEYVEGPTLDAALKRYRLTLADAELLFGGILAGVHAAHASGLVHRDLKPANVLLASTVEGFVPKVTDFGLAKIMIDIPGLAHTKQGISMGTPSYMAPEQIRDAGSVDQRADLWSLGCLLYELMTRRRAFPGDEALAIYNAVVDASFAPPREWAPDLPDRVNEAILGCLQLDPNDRIPDCSTLLDVLQGRLEWEAQTSVLRRQPRWMDEESTEDPLQVGLPAQFSADGPDRPSATTPSGPSIGAEMVMESPGEPTEPVLDPTAGGIGAADLITDDDIAAPVAVVQADTTGFDRQAGALLDDEVTVAVRLTELVPSGELPPRAPRRPRASSGDSLRASRAASRGPRASMVVGIGVVVVLLTGLALGASASVLSYVINRDANVVPLFAAPAELGDDVPSTAVPVAPKPAPPPVASKPVAPRAVPAAVVEPPAPVPPPAKSEPQPPIVEVSPPGPSSPVGMVDEGSPPDPPPAETTTAPETAVARLLSLPYGARVTVDDQSVGRAPLKVDLALGEHVVRMESDGTNSGPLTIQVSRDTITVLCYRFVDGQRFDHLGCANQR